MNLQKTNSWLPSLTIFVASFLLWSFFPAALPIACLLLLFSSELFLLLQQFFFVALLLKVVENVSVLALELWVLGCELVLQMIPVLKL